MTTINESIEINATRDTIRQYYAHPVFATQWASALVLFEPDGSWPRAKSTARMGTKSGGITTEGIATTIAYDEETMATIFPSNPKICRHWNSGICLKNKTAKRRSLRE